MSKYIKNYSLLLKNYMLISSGTSISIMFLNLLSPAFVDEQYLSISENTLTFTFLSIAKGAIFGILWPAVPIKLINNPKDLYILGRGINRHKNIDDIEKYVKRCLNE